MPDFILQLRALYKSYGAVQASENLNVNVERGTIHALIGPNGAGKTTIVNMISGELRQDSGAIILNSADISTLPVYKRVEAGLGRSFQITSLFDSLSVADNMALAILAGDGHNYRFFRNARKAESVTERLVPALTRVDLIDKADRKAGSLSHGEKRQLEVGMALVGNPELLLLDEPMAGLGAGGTVELSKLIEQVKGTMTILLVEHDMNVVFALADRISVIVYGTCIADGTPDEIRNNADVQKAYLGER